MCCVRCCHTGWEEYYDYIFPDEEKASANLKILEMARKWKKAKALVEEGWRIV